MLLRQKCSAFRPRDRFQKIQNDCKCLGKDEPREPESPTEIDPALVLSRVQQLMTGTISLVWKQSPLGDVSQRQVGRLMRCCGKRVTVRWARVSSYQRVLKRTFEQFKDLKLMTYGPDAAPG